MRNERAVDSPIQPCANDHYFQVALAFAPEPERPEWWPKERLSGYGGEKVKVTAAGVAPPDRELDTSGGLRVNGVPSGSAKVEFAHLLTSVKDALDEGCQYAPA